MNTRKNRGVERRDVSSYKYGSIIAKLTFSETKFTPEVIDKLVTSTNDKRKGLEMIRKIIERFDLNSKDIEQYTTDTMIREMVEVRNIKLQEEDEDKVAKPNWNKPSSWDKRYF